MNRVLFSHCSDHWATPSDIYDHYVGSLGYFDPCPLHCESFDGLSIEWKEYNFVNPPYSEISKWVDKALIEREKGHKSVLLVPSRTDTKWFHKCLNAQCSFIFIKGRLKFGGSKNSAPFPSCLIEV